MGKAAKIPKRKCCASTDRCGRCPIRMLADGNLPDGYGVRKRKLVRVDPVTGKASKKKIKKSSLQAAVKKHRKAARRAA